MRSLRFQLLASHVLLVLLMAAVTGLTIAGFVILGRTIGSTLGRNLDGINSSHLVLQALGRQREAISLVESKQFELARKTIDEGWREMMPAIDLMGRQANTREELATSIVIHQKATRYRALLERDWKDPAQRAALPQRLRKIYFPMLRELEVLATSVHEQNQAEILTDNDEARDLAQASIVRAAWVTGIALLLAILLAVRTVRMTLHPLALLARRAEQIAGGDLTPGPTLGRNDEVGRLADSFEEMARKLAEVRRSEVRRIQRAERMSDAALEHLYDPVIVVDNRGRVVHLNQAAEDVFGPLPEGRRVNATEHLQDRRLVRALEQANSEQTVSAGEDESSLITLTRSGRSRTYRMRTTPMRDDEEAMLGSVSVLEDITHMREVDRLKTEFIGVAAHELRTPVASLLLSAQLMQEGAVGDLTPAQRDVVTMQIEDLERLERLTRDLLDVTKLETGRKAPRLEQVSAKDLLANLEKTLRPLAESKGVTFEVDEVDQGERLQADPTQIGQVLTNLATNAIRHTPGGGNVWVKILLETDRVAFSVIDTGEGIPPDYLKRVFERFVQVPGATQGGAGLGLSIAKGIVEAHGGQMEAGSTLGMGSTFRFWLPRSSTRRTKSSVAIPTTTEDTKL